MSRLYTTGETIPHDDDDDIPVFELDLVNVELELNKSPDHVDFIDVQYTEVDELYAGIKTPIPTNNFEPIVEKELLQAQLRDEFCATIRRKLNEGGYPPLNLTTTEFLFARAKRTASFISKLARHWLYF